MNPIRFVERIDFMRMGIFILALTVLWGCGIKLLPSHDQWYMQHYIIMQDFERDTYKNLTDGGKAEFQGLFWEARRPESKAEFDKRMAHVMKQFKRENSAHPWNTDRGRIYLLNGSPAAIEFKRTDDWGITMSQQPTAVVSDRSNENIEAKTAEGWTYQFQKAQISYIFTFSAPKAWELRQTSFEGNRYLGEFEMQSRELFFGVIDLEAYTQALERLKAIK